MRYASNADLPSSVRDQLPWPAQDIYRRAFNDAYEKGRDDPLEEAAADRIAWDLVERSYVKEGGVWVLRGVPG